MQGELDDESLPSEVVILGINRKDSAAGNDQICDGRDLPWLQDTDAADVWGLWSITYRDVVILDAENEVVGIYNLTTNTLSDPTNYEALKSMIRNAAMAAGDPTP